MGALGMESGEVSPDQITASSQYNDNWSPERSRLNYQENGWTPSDDSIKEWIQVPQPPPPLHLQRTTQFRVQLPL